MKNKTAILAIVVIISTVLSFFCTYTPCYATGEPIPGIDIIVRKKPSGVVVSQTKTDPKGRFEIKDLKKGEYLLHYQPTANISYNSSKSNSAGKAANNNYNESKSNSAGIMANNSYKESKSNSAGKILKDGMHLIEVQIELVPALDGKGKESFEPVNISITAERGTIKGEIIQAFGLTEPGVK